MVAPHPNGTVAGAVFECAPSLLKCPSILVSVNETLQQSYTCIEPKDFTCNSYNRKCDCPNLNPDPDIAGIGVVLSFFVVGVISLIVYLVCLFLSMINTTSLNPVDRRLREQVTKFMSHRISDDTKELWVKVLTKVLLGLSDQQLVTCLAILIVAIVKLADGSLTVYHFSICADLAWFSNGVHSITLGMLNSYFRRRVKFPQRATSLEQFPDNGGTGKIRKKRLPLMTGLRIVLMSICSILLLFCLVIEGYRSWYDAFQCPVDCARRDLKGKYGGEPGAWSTASIVLFLLNYPVSMMQLSNSGVKILHDVRFKHMKKLDSKLKPSGSPDSMKARSYATLARVAKYSWWLFNSIIFDICLTFLWFGLGVSSLLSDRALGHEIMRSQNVENTELQWGFGQLVPLIICVLPVITAGENFWDEYLARIGQADEYDEEPASSGQSEDQMGIMLDQGALYSEPATVDPSDASVLSIESNTTTPPVGSSSGVAQPQSPSNEGHYSTFRRSTFPIDRIERT